MQVQTRMQKILQKTGGILKDKMINPVSFERKLRNEWSRREKREYANPNLNLLENLPE